DLLDTQLEIFLDRDDANALFDRPGIVVALVERAANADLYDAPGIEQPFFDGAAERRSVSVFVAAEIGVPGIAMGVEMHHAERRLTLGDAAHDRQRDQMVATGR